jgi:hypothetical protein
LVSALLLFATMLALGQFTQPSKPPGTPVQPLEKWPPYSINKSEGCLKTCLQLIMVIGYQFNSRSYATDKDDSGVISQILSAAITDRVCGQCAGARAGLIKRGRETLNAVLVAHQVNGFNDAVGI